VLALTNFMLTELSRPLYETLALLGLPELDYILPGLVFDVVDNVAAESELLLTLIEASLRQDPAPLSQLIYTKLCTLAVYATPAADALVWALAPSLAASLGITGP